MSDAGQKIDAFIDSHEGWKRENLVKFRRLVHVIEPNVQEAMKWSVPVFSVNGKLVCAMSSFKAFTKYNFFEGGSLEDTHKLFNNGLDSKQHRSIDLHEGETVDDVQLSELLQEAFAVTRL